jgi:hypothetical protein
MRNDDIAECSQNGIGLLDKLQKASPPHDIIFCELPKFQNNFFAVLSILTASACQTVRTYSSKIQLDFATIARESGRVGF